MREVLELAPNVPVEIALAYGAGKIIDTAGGAQRVMFSLVNGKVMFLDLDVAQRVNELGVKPRQPFYIVKNKGGKRTDPVEWRVWMSPEASIGEQPDGTFVVPVQPAASVRPPAAGVAPSQERSLTQSDVTKPSGSNGNGHGNGNGLGAGDPRVVVTDGRPRTRLTDALCAVVGAIFEANRFAKEIGYQMPPFTSEDIRTMANTIMIGGAK
jgi:hypothetical protein